ncbi:MAG: amidohydrolase family protein [Nitrososphaerota archaeon]|jgi:5-methylthioadenosine/S-adenosylhomocysteine deaminase|nr:amidohydrolase family protein [Nitrososphaerota archaeon]MDG6927888.1 amidohydrolase family protein [Nitrososphaerota archaeon]MDG6931033.1 amidohydrolase family protein [Nitrososphaerota archaeon]MDG6936662.1 amidohydrolase family protein [Nitrososphaerota archaeon]MDG6944268.1 amidohydrolase family protein [Nitrososphaerota archaeon]
MLPGSEWQPISDPALLVEDGKIIYAGPLKEGMDYDEVHDLGKSMIMPSFANTHSHVAMTLMRGIGEQDDLHSWLGKVWNIEGKLKHEELVTGNVVGIGEMLDSGITSFLDFYDIQPMVQALKELNFPIRAKLALSFLDTVEYMKEESWKRVRNVDSYARQLSEHGIEMVLSPHSLYAVSEELLVEIAKIRGYRVQIHLSETLEEDMLIKEKHGLRPVEYLKSVGLLRKGLIAAHAVHLNDEEIRQLATAGVNVAHCPSSNARLGSGIANISKMDELNMNVSLGTDGAGSSEVLDMFNEMKLAVMLSRASSANTRINARKALKMATLNGHGALGIPAGYLGQGMLADFIAVDLTRTRPSWDTVSSVVYQGGHHTVKDVIVGGKLVKENHRLIFEDKFEEHKSKLEDFMRGA